MKKINLILGALVCMFAFSACTEEVEYTPAQPEAAKGVYFPEPSATIQLVAGQTSIDVNVCRVNKTVAQDVAIKVVSNNDEAGVLTVPEQVSFNAGDSVTTLTIACDMLKKSPSSTLNLQIEIEGASTYEKSSMALTVKLPAWKSLGLAQYTDDFIASLFTDVEPVTYNVEIQENVETPGLYRLVNPYGAAFPYNQEGDWNTSSDFYLEINAIDPQGVYIETQALGFDWGYGEFLASSQTAQLLANYDLETIKAAGGYCGTLVDGVITFPAKALLVSAESLDGWYYANSNSAFKVVLPSASKSSKSVKAITNRVKADKKNIGGQRLKKMDRQFPTVANKK